MFGLFAALWAVEAVADEQQWRFQTAKYKLRAERARLTGEYADGFLQSGLFRYSVGVVVA